MKAKKQYILTFEAEEKELESIDGDTLTRKIQRELRRITGTDVNFNIDLRLRHIEKVNLKYKYLIRSYDEIKIMEILEKGDSVELIPEKDGIKIISKGQK